MHASLVGEGAHAHERLIGTQIQIRRFIHKPREFGKMREARACQHLVSLLLEREVAHNGDQINIAAPFSHTVDCALHLNRAGIHRRERISHGEFAIVVAMNANGRVEFRRDCFHEFD